MTYSNVTHHFGNIRHRRITKSMIEVIKINQMSGLVYMRSYPLNHCKLWILWINSNIKLMTNLSKIYKLFTKAQTLFYQKFMSIKMFFIIIWHFNNSTSICLDYDNSFIWKCDVFCSCSADMLGCSIWENYWYTSIYISFLE